MIKFTCPNCQKPINVPEEYAGKQGRCKSCGTAVRVPPLHNESAENSKIKFRCPACSKKMAVPPEYAGKKGKCKGCGQSIRVPMPRKEAQRQPLPTSEDNTGSDAMLNDNIFTKQLLDMESKPPTIEDELKLKPLEPTSQKTETGFPESAVDMPDQSGLYDTYDETGAKSGNIGMAILAGLGLTILGAVGWALLASLLPLGWVLPILVLVVGPLAGVGITLVTNDRSTGIGMLAVLLAFIGILTGKVLIAKWAIMPEFNKIVNESMTEIPDEEITDEVIDDILKNEDIMVVLTLMQMEDDGELEEGYVKEAGKALLAPGPKDELEQKFMDAKKIAIEKMDGLSDNEKRDLVKNQYPQMFKEFAEVFMDSGIGKAVTGVMSFIGAFSCLDVLWIPMALFMAFKIGAGRE